MNIRTGADFYLIITIIVSVLLLPATGWAGTFTDNFGDGNADEWTIDENAASDWEVMDGGYHGSIVSATESIALIGEDDWDVESIEVKVRDAQGEWLAIVWRYRDLNNFESWWLSIINGTLEAWPKVGDYEGAARVSVAVPFDPAEEFTIRVAISGSDFDVFFNGDDMGTYSNDVFDVGKVGLLVWAGSATFDDVVITGPNIVGGLAVKPFSKTSTLWGKLKFSS